MSEPLATAHYSFYPKVSVKPLWAYAFRPFFLIIPSYIVLCIGLWLGHFLWGWELPLLNTTDALASIYWHIFELLFAVGSAGIIAFLLTAIPEMYPGQIPIIGRRLQMLVTCWLLARLSIWLMAYSGPWFALMVNTALFIYLVSLIYRPLIKQQHQRHLSFLLGVILLGVLQTWSLLIFTGVLSDYPRFNNPMAVFYLGLHGFMLLILLVLRRVSMEVVNEALHCLKSEDSYFSRPPRYNLAIFTVVLFAIAEFSFPNNSALAWLALACGAAIFAILNDYILDTKAVLISPWVVLLISVYAIMGLGYFMIAWDYLSDSIYALNHFRHLLSMGAFGLSFYLIMLIVSHVHTGRALVLRPIHFYAGLAIVLASVLRSAISLWPELAPWLYGLSTLLWLIPFIIFLITIGPYLLRPRIDNLPG